MRKTFSGLFLATICPVTLFTPIATSQDLAASPTSPSADTVPTSSTVASSSSFVRFADDYKEDWHPAQPAGPDPARRGYVANPITPEIGANGAFCSFGEKTCFAPEAAVVNYLEHEFNTHNYLSIRNEFVDDIKGQRTGYTTKYSEHLISYGRWIGSTVLFRPEIRLEHSYDLAAYDLGTKKTQFIVAGDLTYHF
jgi:hypothetical protein